MEEILEKGFVKESLSPWAVPIIFVSKKDGTWRICIDYRVIIKITIQHQNPIPWLDDILDELYHLSAFSNIDLRSG